MKDTTNKYSLMFWVFFIILTIKSPAQEGVNLLEGKYYGIEGAGEGWSTSKEKNWNYSTSNPASGNYSLKFSCSEFPADVKNMQMQKSDVLLAKGIYTITAKIFIEENSEIVGFNINLKKPFESAKFKLKKVPTGQWVEISQDMIVEKEGSKLVVAVSTNPKWGGKGTFYLDDIKISKKKKYNLF